jgi:RNA polymerase sigma-70 factor, ECF subfamily
MVDETAVIATAWADEQALVERLRAGEEAAFAGLIDQYHGSLLGMARSYTRDAALAEEMAQDTWIGLLDSLGRFEGRSSLKTWILSILVNQAKTRGSREARTVPFATLAPEDDAPAVDPERFRGPHEQYAGGWRAFPGNWKAADELVQDRETIRVAMRAIADLPLTQQTVIRMRDVEGYSADEVCAALDVSEANQRVLLHRARSRVRSALERHIDG